MARLTDYRGKMLNHVETLYPPGERMLATRFCEALGCTVVDTGVPSDSGVPYLLVFPDSEERDAQNNVLYLNEVRPIHWNFDRELARLLADESNPIAGAYEEYRHKALNAPHGIPHFGLRYTSFQSLEGVLGRLLDLGPEFDGRVRVGSVVRPGDAGSMTDDLLQAFVFTDLVVSGMFAIGQLIELQAQKLLPPTS